MNKDRIKDFHKQGQKQRPFHKQGQEQGLFINKDRIKGFS